uniref:Uncharacterized protein n=1 Tax=Avena sativa TaxID=4498 RepID=A0ACD5X7F5_AVESA
MVGQCGSDVVGDTVVASADHPQHLGLLQDQVVGNNGTTSRELVNGYDVREPPVDAEAVAERADQVAALLAAFSNHLHERTAHHLGYPFNLDFDFSMLAQFQNLSINNLGDPFIESNYGVHSRLFEVAVLDWFARLWDLQQDEYWGYITNGGTEGNMHGLLVGRELFPDGVIYASRESHYSLTKPRRLATSPEWWVTLSQ